MPKCSYCGKEYEFPRGLTLVKTDTNVKYLCSGKCRKNMLMNKRKIRWISKSENNKKRVKKKYSLPSINRIFKVEIFINYFCLFHTDK